MCEIILLPLNFVKAVIDFVKIEIDFVKPVTDLTKLAEEIGLAILFKWLYFYKILQAVMSIKFQISQPDLLVYLHSPIEKLQWNILNRGRVYERKMEDSYLQGLQETYFKYLHSQQNARVLVINCAALDFVNKPTDYEFLLELVCKQYPVGITYL